MERGVDHEGEGWRKGERQDARSEGSTGPTKAPGKRRPVGIDLVFGSITGMTSKVFEHPFDLVKVRLQTQALGESGVIYHGAWDCATRTFAREGWRGLYRGLSAPALGAMVENAALFLAYNQAKEAFFRQTGTRRLTLPQLLVCGAFAGSVASFFLTPIELVKCRMQIQLVSREIQLLQGKGKGSPGRIDRATFGSLPGPLQIVRDTLARHGIRGLWHGQLGTLLRESGGGGAWFGAYEACTKVFKARHPEDPTLGAIELVVSGAAAGMSYNLILFPADSIKSAMQTESEGDRGSQGKGRRTFLTTSKAIYQVDGLKGFYRGCGVTVMRSAPSSALIFLIYEHLNRFFGYDTSEA